MLLKLEIAPFIRSDITVGEFFNVSIYHLIILNVSRFIFLTQKPSLKLAKCE